MTARSRRALFKGAVALVALPAIVRAQAWPARPIRCIVPLPPGGGTDAIGRRVMQRLSEALGLEPHGMVRIGLLHYNTAEEIDRLLEALREL